MGDEPGGMAGVFDRAADAYDAVGVPWFGRPGGHWGSTWRRGWWGVRQLLLDAGLVDVRTAHRQVTARFTDPQQWLEFSWSHGQRAMWEAVPAEEHDSVRVQVVELLGGFTPLGFDQTIRHTLGRRP